MSIHSEAMAVVRRLQAEQPLKVRKMFKMFGIGEKYWDELETEVWNSVINNLQERANYPNEISAWISRVSIFTCVEFVKKRKANQVDSAQGRSGTGSPEDTERAAWAITCGNALDQQKEEEVFPEELRPLMLANRDRPLMDVLTNTKYYGFDSSSLMDCPINHPLPTERGISGDNSFDWQQVAGNSTQASLTKFRNHRHPPLTEKPQLPSLPPPTPADERLQHLDALLATVPEDAKQRLGAVAAALNTLAESWPEDIEYRARALAEAHLAYRQEYASQLGPIINKRIDHAIKNNTSYEYKGILIKHLNEELRQGGLAIRCEVRDASGNIVDYYPGIFVIGTARHEGGRFRVEYQDGSGKKTFGLSDESAPLELMPAPSRHARELGTQGTESFTERLAEPHSTQSPTQL